MEIILKQDVKNLGHKDQVVKVRNGYGLNFLIPKGVAVVASESNMKVHNETMKQRAFKEDKLRKEAETLAETIKNKTFRVGMKVGESGKIFGSVTTIQIADAIKKAGYNIDRKLISLADEHIKELGTYTATISLHKDIKVTVSFDVVKE